MDRGKVVYLRCSTHNQDHQTVEHAMRAAFQGQLADARWLRDTESGSKASRPAYDTLKGIVAQGRVDVVYVYSWDRIARTIKELLTFVELCQKHHVQVVSLKNNIDTSGTLGKAIVCILGVCAEIEHKMIYARLTDGLRRKVVEEGWRPGGSVGGWNAKKTIKRAQAVYDLLDAGHSVSKVCRMLHIDHRTVAKLVACRGEKLPRRADVSGEVQYRRPADPEMYTDTDR